MCKIIIVKKIVFGIFIVSTAWNCSSYQYSYGTKENDTLLRVTRQLQEEVIKEQVCLTPPQPTNGSWFYLNTAQSALPLQNVSVNTTIGFKCDNGYVLSSNDEDTDFLTCGDGSWNVTSIPSCNMLCPPFYNTSVITVYCKIKYLGSTVACDKAIDGTSLTYKCASYYMPSSPTPSEIMCFGGAWNYKPLCIPECGKKILKAATLIVGGHNSKRGKYPWVVALFSSRESDPYLTLICGGTLLTTDIVLTAAHCVTRLHDGKIYDQKYFRVSAGKIFNEYEDLRDMDTAQKSTVTDIITHQEYKGERQNYRFDIAILKLQTPFFLSNVVQPACYHGLKEYLSEADAQGWVSGWGYTKSGGEPSEILKEVNLPIRDRDKCSKDFEQDWADQFFTEEKLCAGYLNQNTSVCKGDSGGGLVLEHSDRRYYVYGIVSLGYAFIENNEKHCDIQKSALFTSVQFYSKWLQNKVTQLSCQKCHNTTNGLSTEGCDFCTCIHKFCPANFSSADHPSRLRGSACVTPMQPANGTWVYPSNNKIGVEGQEVYENTVIYFSCNKGYMLSTESKFIICLKNGWSSDKMPKCYSESCHNTITEVLGKTNICSGDDVINYKFTEDSPDSQIWLIEQFIPSEPDWEYVVYKNESDVIKVENNALRIGLKILPEYEMNDIVLDGCTRQDNPIQCSRLKRFLSRINSGRIVSRDAFCFGNITVKAKLPQGDWIFPEIYLESVQDSRMRIYLAYARGNKELIGKTGDDIGGKILFGGPHKTKQITSYLASYSNQKHIGAEWHVFSMTWTKDRIELYVDNINYGHINDDALKATGFDQKNMVRLVLGLGVGGLYDFPDGYKSGSEVKPWINVNRNAIKNFFSKQDVWQKTWNGDHQLLVEYVTVKAL